MSLDNEMIPRIDPNEFEIIGGTTYKHGKPTPDENSLRIATLRNHLLVKVAASATHWTVLYRDPTDGRYWELVEQSPSNHAGGCLCLVFISENEAKVKYQLDEI